MLNHEQKLGNKLTNYFINIEFCHNSNDFEDKWGYAVEHKVIELLSDGKNLPSAYSRGTRAPRMKTRTRIKLPDWEAEGHILSSALSQVSSSEATFHWSIQGHSARVGRGCRPKERFRVKVILLLRLPVIKIIKTMSLVRIWWCVWLVRP